MKLARFFPLILIVFGLTACETWSSIVESVSAPTAIARKSCTPTIADDLSPTYKPDTPVRSVVGHGHILVGVVLSNRDCLPIAGAKLELWPEENGSHPDEYRATVFADRSGLYRFECNLPDHIHMRISAPGYRTIASNAYHPAGKAAGTFDIVLVPEKP